MPVIFNRKKMLESAARGIAVIALLRRVERRQGKGFLDFVDPGFPHSNAK
jgi:hypothetical protein